MYSLGFLRLVGVFETLLIWIQAVWLNALDILESFIHNYTILMNLLLLKMLSWQLLGMKSWLAVARDR